MTVKIIRPKEAVNYIVKSYTSLLVKLIVLYVVPFHSALQVRVSLGYLVLLCCTSIHLCRAHWNHSCICHSLMRPTALCRSVDWVRLLYHDVVFNFDILLRKGGS